MRRARQLTPCNVPSQSHRGAGTLTSALDQSLSTLLDARLEEMEEATQFNEYWQVRCVAARAGSNV